MSEYQTLLDGEEYIGEDYWKDDIVMDNNQHPCYICGEPSEFYNSTIGRSECETHLTNETTERF